MLPLEILPTRERTVAFFYITSNGEVNVRRPSDYLPKMIELAGGTYLPQNLKEDENSRSSTISMQMEEFYAASRDGRLYHIQQHH